MSEKCHPQGIAAILFGVAVAVGLGVGVVGCSARDSVSASVAQMPTPPASPPPAVQPARSPIPQPDRSGHTRIGIASFYAAWFAGREMADGTPMDPGGDNAASRTLPLGTTARVTNLSTGQSALITIQDRGPYAKGRLIDLSPATAEKIGITRKKGVARVRVSPIAVPLPDGTVKPGVAAQDVEVPQLR
jgi:rare lipoprotein A